MAVLDISKIKSPQELEGIARRDLEGKTLSDIYKLVQKTDSVSRVSSKAGVGDVIEQGYFGIPRNSFKGPDLPSLGVEVKTSPLTLGVDGKLRVKEPLSLNIINYIEEAKNDRIKQSSLYKKNHYILFVCYIHDLTKKRSEYVIKYVFLWEMNNSVLTELSDDYSAIISKIRNGEAHHIHQSDHKWLTLCPKHGGTFKDPKDGKSKTKQPFSNAPAEIRAFRLKNSYMNLVIHRYLSKYRRNEIMEFVTPKII
jgi:DNA mismatch repair protein MutH